MSLSQIIVYTVKANAKLQLLTSFMTSMQTVYNYNTVSYLQDSEILSFTSFKYKEMTSHTLW